MPCYSCGQNIVCDRGKKKIYIKGKRSKAIWNMDIS